MEIVLNPFSYKGAGESLSSPLLKGLPVRLQLRLDSSVDEVFFYSSDVRSTETHKYNLAFGGGIWSYAALAGIAAFGSTVWEASESWSAGVIFYLSFYIRETNKITKIAERKLVIREIPSNCVLLGNDKQSYKTPYVILEGNLSLLTELFPFWKNEAGVKNYGGAKTVEIIDTPGAPGTGYLNVLGERNIFAFDLTEIFLLDRELADKIPDYVTYPGAPDFSNWFYFLTFRFRIKAADAYYVDWNIILFMAGRCGGGVIGEDSESTIPPPMCFINSVEEFPPPPECSSHTKITMSEEVNQYTETQVNIWSQASGGSLIASGQATVAGPSSHDIARTELGGYTVQPVEGYGEVVESQPERTSENREELIVYGCVEIPIKYRNGGGDIIDYDPGDSTIRIITTELGDPFHEDEEYVVEIWTDEPKYGEDPDEIKNGTRLDAHTLEIELTEGEHRIYIVVTKVVGGERRRISKRGYIFVNIETGDCSETISINTFQGTYIIDQVGHYPPYVCRWETRFSGGHEPHYVRCIYNRAKWIVYLYDYTQSIATITYRKNISGYETGPCGTYVFIQETWPPFLQERHGLTITVTDGWINP